MVKKYDNNWTKETLINHIKKLIKDFPCSPYLNDRKKMLKSLVGEQNGKNKTTKKIEKIK
jgi:outer membrane protein assembly factor BamD (BamD/ComL family)